MRVFKLIPFSIAWSFGLLLASSGWVAYADLAFTDVPENSRTRPAIEALVAKNVFSGYPDHTFRPHKPVTRAEFAVILAKSQGLILPLSPFTEPSPFSDLPVAHWARPAIQEVMEKGWMTGYPHAHFYPNRNITKVELFAVLVKAAQCPLLSHEEAQILLQGYEDAATLPTWQAVALATALKYNLLKEESISSGSVKKLYAHIPASRASVAMAIQRLLLPSEDHLALHPFAPAGQQSETPMPPTGSPNEIEPTAVLPAVPLPAVGGLSPEATSSSLPSQSATDFEFGNHPLSEPYSTAQTTSTSEPAAILPENSHAETSDAVGATVPLSQPSQLSQWSTPVAQSIAEARPRHGVAQRVSREVAHPARTKKQAKQLPAEPLPVSPVSMGALPYLTGQISPEFNVANPSQPPVKKNRVTRPPQSIEWVATRVPPLLPQWKPNPILKNSDFIGWTESAMLPQQAFPTATAHPPSSRRKAPSASRRTLKPQPIEQSAQRPKDSVSSPLPITELGPVAEPMLAEWPTLPARSAETKTGKRQMGQLGANAKALKPEKASRPPHVHQKIAKAQPVSSSPTVPKAAHAKAHLHDLASASPFSALPASEALSQRPHPALQPGQSHVRPVVAGLLPVLGTPSQALQPMAPTSIAMGHPSTEPARASVEPTEPTNQEVHAPQGVLAAPNGGNAAMMIPPVMELSPKISAILAPSSVSLRQSSLPKGLSSLPAEETSATETKRSASTPTDASNNTTWTTLTGRLEPNPGNGWLFREEETHQAYALEHIEQKQNQAWFRAGRQVRVTGLLHSLSNGLPGQTAPDVMAVQSMTPIPVPRVQQQTVSLYFPNLLNLLHNPETLLGSPISRVLSSGNLPKKAIEAILAGPTQEERMEGFFLDDELPQLSVSRLTISPQGQATVVLSAPFSFQFKTSQSPHRLDEQLVRTLKQFPGIYLVKLKVVGPNNTTLWASSQPH